MKVYTLKIRPGEHGDIITYDPTEAFLSKEKAKQWFVETFNTEENRRKAFRFYDEYIEDCLQNLWDYWVDCVEHEVIE